MKISIFVAVLALAVASSAAEVVVGVPSSLRYPVQEIAAAFQQANPGVSVLLVHRSADEISIPTADGKNLDLYIAEDMKAVTTLAGQEGVVGEPTAVAVARIVLWTRRDGGVDLKKNLEALLDKEASIIVIPDPQNDPHGRRAKSTLLKKGIWKRVERKVLKADSGGDVACLLLETKAPVAIIPLPVAQTPFLKGLGYYYQIHDEDYEPLEYGYFIFRGSAKKQGVSAFAAFLKHRDAQKIFKRYGLSIPGVGKPLDKKAPGVLDANGKSATH